jgi:hypothetical protein
MPQGQFFSSTGWDLLSIKRKGRKVVGLLKPQPSDSWKGKLTIPQSLDDLAKGTITCEHQARAVDSLSPGCTEQEMMQKKKCVIYEDWLRRIVPQHQGCLNQQTSSSCSPHPPIKVDALRMLTDP